MNRALLTTVLSLGLPLANLQSYGQSALTLLERLGSTTQTWARELLNFQGPVLAATGIAGVVVLLMLVWIVVLRTRARRATQTFQEELAKLVALTQESQSANEAKAEFLASMSHRIRTAMNAIVGFTDLALKTDLDPELREYLDTVRTSADWLIHIADDVLEFSRIEAGRLQLDNVPFSISDCILSAMKIAEQEASAKKLVTTCKIDPRLSQVAGGDPARLRHVILNLLDYAVRFTTSGSVTLSAALESNSADHVLVSVAVTDTGPGIPPARQSLIFEPFRHADAGGALKSGETGLGLAISRRLVDLMGGSMKVTSQLGAGSTFEFTARFQKQKTSAQLDAPVRAPESVEPKKISILVAEDKALDRSLIPETSSPDKGLVIEPRDNVFTPKHVGQKVTTESGVTGLAIDTRDSTRFHEEKTAVQVDVPVRTPETVALKDLSILVADKARDRSPVFETSSHDSRSNIKNPEPVTSAPLPDLKNFAIQLAGNVFTPKYIEQEITTVSDITELALGSGDSSADSGESEFALKAILSKSDDLALDTAGTSCISEVDAISSTDFLHSGPIETLNSTPYLIATLAAAETDVLSGAIERDVTAEIVEAYNSTIDSPFDTAIDEAGKLVIADSDEALLREVHQSAEIISMLAVIEASYHHSDDSGPAAVDRLSPPAVVALVEATCQLTQQLPSLVKQDDGSMPTAAWDPFEQARKSLSKSRFDVRVIHNDGDPSDRNLI